MNEDMFSDSMISDCMSSWDSVSDDLFPNGASDFTSQDMVDSCSSVPDSYCSDNEEVLPPDYKKMRPDPGDTFADFAFIDHFNVPVTLPEDDDVDLFQPGGLDGKVDGNQLLATQTAHSYGDNVGRLGPLGSGGLGDDQFSYQLSSYDNLLVARSDPVEVGNTCEKDDAPLKIWKLLEDKGYISVDSVDFSCGDSFVANCTVNHVCQKPRKFVVANCTVNHVCQKPRKFVGVGNNETEAKNDSVQRAKQWIRAKEDDIRSVLQCQGFELW